MLTNFGTLDYNFVDGGCFMVVNISEAKAKLSKLIDMVYHGEEVVIAKNNLPIADLVKHKPSGARKLGLMEGKIDIPDDFVEESKEINEMFYGEDSENTP